MSLTYAGVPLLLEDPQHQFQRWLERYLSLADARFLAPEPIAYRDGRWLPRGTGGPHATATHNVPMPLWNWDHRPPRWKLNTLWVPTGASRWATGLFFCTESALQDIQDATTLGTSAWLEWDDGTAERQFALYALPAVPITPWNSGGKENVWLLPLVDARYFWQWLDSGDLAIADDDATWTGIFAHLAGRLGISFDPAQGVDFEASGWAYPDEVEWTRRHENAAVLMDAACACVGHRFVWDVETELAQLFSTGYYTTGDTLAGASSVEWRPEVRFPSQVKVVFPRYNPTGYSDTGEVYTVTVPISAPGGGDSALTKTYYDTARATFASSSASQPSNLSALNSLAETIAGAFEDSLTASTLRDAVWPLGGLSADANILAMADAAWWHFGHQLFEQPRTPTAACRREEDPGGAYAVWVRVSGLPWESGVSNLWHQTDSPPRSSSSQSSSSSSTSSSSSSQSTSSQSQESWSSASTSSQSSSSQSNTSASTSSESSAREQTVTVVTDVECIDDELFVHFANIVFDRDGHYIRTDF